MDLCVCVREECRYGKDTVTYSNNEKRVSTGMYAMMWYVYEGGQITGQL